MEFPTTRPDLDGRPHRYVYADRLERDEAGFHASALLKIDTVERRTHALELGEGFICGEPVFVPRAAHASEDDGHVLSLCYDGSAHRSFLLVLDARSFTELARAHLPFHLPMGLHASFSPA